MPVLLYNESRGARVIRDKLSPKVQPCVSRSTRLWRSLLCAAALMALLSDTSGLQYRPASKKRNNVKAEDEEKLRKPGAPWRALHEILHKIRR